MRSGIADTIRARRKQLLGFLQELAGAAYNIPPPAAGALLTEVPVDGGFTTKVKSVHTPFHCG